MTIPAPARSALTSAAAAVSSGAVAMSATPRLGEPGEDLAAECVRDRPPSWSTTTIVVWKVGVKSGMIAANAIARPSGVRTANRIADRSRSRWRRIRRAMTRAARIGGLAP